MRGANRLQFIIETQRIHCVYEVLQVVFKSTQQVRGRHQAAQGAGRQVLLHKPQLL